MLQGRRGRPARVLQRGTQTADERGRWLERLATSAVVLMRALRLGATRGAGAGVFADVVDVEDIVQISLASVAEKARSFTS